MYDLLPLYMLLGMGVFVFIYWALTLFIIMFAGKEIEWKWGECALSVIYWAVVGILAGGAVFAFETIKSIKGL